MAWLWQQYQENSLSIAVICGGLLILSLTRQAWLNWFTPRSSVARLLGELALVCAFVAVLWAALVVQGWFRPSWPHSVTLGPEVGEKAHPGASPRGQPLAPFLGWGRAL